ncbi:MAG: citrate/2-methylcitrate synthase [Planctomycetota bacterium]|jgi:citrate synthase
MANDSLTITDNRTGKSYELPIRYGTFPEYGASISALDLRQIKASPEDFGLLTYDPGYTNTCSCRSAITFVDNGELPMRAELDQWVHDVTMHTIVHENIKTFMNGFHYDAHPMGILVGTLGALSTFYPEAKRIDDEAVRRKQIQRLVAKTPTIAAFAYRHSRGLPYVYPDNDLSYTGNFLSMLFRATELKYEPNPVLERALEVLFILHADHEQNCSTSAMRGIGSSNVDPYSAMAGAAAALYGPRHGGANEAVLRMLAEIGSVDRVPAFVKAVKSGEAGRLMGFGHRVYKNYDPRAKVIKQLAHEVFEVTGTNPLLDVALELERIALADEYFVSRKLYPNVDFYSGIIYQGMGFPVDMFPVLFAIPRTAGWLAQWQELLGDEDQRIARPRQVYTGEEQRDYVGIDERG